ncbi:hypothetical protein SAMN04488494_0261 [Xylanibacter ruminicola]|uniref:Uncharacterized protein n=1 Tax=Xylanibacter ruminicola TaxID=839 RepID=A0A1M7NZN8_XYLRU|nr:hypothetical protein SAMN04488493_11743 [Xylanibacter ruminicola]SHN09566.1 hypothetical protein SAMN04488494_0261 [Xylanibacter ruminicola]
MITKDSIETAYSFLHQKRNVYTIIIVQLALIVYFIISKTI